MLRLFTIYDLLPPICFRSCYTYFPCSFSFHFAYLSFRLLFLPSILNLLSFLRLSFLFLSMGWDLRHQVLRPLLAYCTAPDD
jgi:hypothetical protein